MPGNAEIVREACKVVWTEGRADRVADFYAEEFKADYPHTRWGEGLDGVRKLVGDVRAGIPDYGEEIKLLIESGEYVVVELEIRGTHTVDQPGIPATGSPVSFRDVTILRLRDGKIIEQRGLTDTLSALQQMGVTKMPRVHAPRPI